MAGVKAFTNAFRDPESVARDIGREIRLDIYWQRWSYYQDTMYSQRMGENWSAYLDQRELYKKLRLIYNPVPQIVNFYVDNIWRKADRRDFEALATPLSESTDETIVKAVAQLDQWSNFLSESQKIKRYAAACGNVLVEGVDDLLREKITYRTVWPGHVTDFELNAGGDLVSYTLEYNIYDRKDNKTWRFKKIVNKESFSYFRDDRPYIPEGQTSAVIENPYGFVFAVWLRHSDDGSEFGLPACRSFDKVDNLNSLASHIDDYIHKNIESPKLIAAPGEIEPIIGAYKDDRTGILTPQDPRLNWVVFKVNTGGSNGGPASVHDLSGILKLAEAEPLLKSQIESFADDYPELQAHTIVQKNSQLSGAALERMLTPAQNKLDGAQAGYNQQLIKLEQMAIAVGGYRLRSGWTMRSAQQQNFAPFDLNSYAQGKLDFTLKRSVLIQETEAESEEVKMKKAQRSTELKDVVDRRERLAIAGYSDDEIEDLLKTEPEKTVIPAGLPENRQLEAVN